MLTEEELAVRDLQNEMFSMRSLLSNESTNNKNLQAQMDDEGLRFEQRLAMFASHPMPKESRDLSIDGAAKIKGHRLRQELAEAESALPVGPDIAGEEAVQDEQLVVAMSNLKK